MHTIPFLSNARVNCNCNVGGEMCQATKAIWHARVKSSALATASQQHLVLEATWGKSFWYSFFTNFIG